MRTVDGVAPLYSFRYSLRPMNSYNAYMAHNTENSMETTRVVGRPFPKVERKEMASLRQNEVSTLLHLDNE